MIKKILYVSLIAIIFIVIAVDLIADYENYSVKFRFGDVVLTDTLSGSLKLSSGNYYGDNYFAEKMYFNNEIATDDGYLQILYNNVFGKIDFLNTSPVSQSSMNFNVSKANGMFRYYIGSESTLISQIDSVNGIKANSGVTLPEGDVSNANLESGAVKIYVSGKKLIFQCNSADTIKYFYLDFTAESDQTLIYSGTKP